MESGERSVKATNKSLLQINCSLFSHTHKHTRKRYEKQCSGPNPISTSRFITQAGGAKKLSQEDRGSGGGSIFQYSPVCSTGPRRYPTSSRQTRRRQMTPMSGTWEGKARGPAVGSQSHCVSGGTFMWKRSQARKQMDLIAQDTKQTCG